VCIWLPDLCPLAEGPAACPNPHAAQCILIGYPTEYKGWRFWNPQTRKEIISDSAVFRESGFPFWKPGLSKADRSVDPSPPTNISLQEDNHPPPPALVLQPSGHLPDPNPLPALAHIEEASNPEVIPNLQPEPGLEQPAQFSVNSRTS